MTAKTTLFVLFLFLFYSKVSGQTQTGLIKDPAYTVLAAYDSKYGSSVNLPDNSTAMIVSMSKVDFAILSLDAGLTEKWTTPLNGFPLAIGKFKNHILVVSATDRTWMKSFNSSYKAYLLDEKTGKVVSEKIIYEGNQAFLEDPDFYFAKDGSYFKMTARLTGQKRKAGLLGVNRSDKDYRTTQSFTIIEFDGNLNQRDKINPHMPEGESWNASCGADGSFLVTAIDKAKAKLNIATYVSSSAEPLKTVSIPINIRKSSDVNGIYSAAGSQPLINYAAFTYLTPDKEVALFVARVDFKTGTFKSTVEVFDGKHVKELRKSFNPVNKKFDDLDFSKLDFLDVRHLAEYDGKLLVSLSPRYTVTGKYHATFEHSVLLNVYNEQLKQVYHQFIPRVYMSVDGEGSQVAYSLKNNILRFIANVKPGTLTGTYSLYAEMNFNTGQMLKMTRIPDQDISAGHYVNPESVSWLDQSCIVPYLDRQRILSTKLHMQIQLLKY